MKDIRRSTCRRLHRVFCLLFSVGDGLQGHLDIGIPLVEHGHALIERLVPNVFSKVPIGKPQGYFGSRRLKTKQCQHDHHADTNNSSLFHFAYPLSFPMRPLGPNPTHTVSVFPHLLSQTSLLKPSSLEIATAVSMTCALSSL